MNKRNRNLVPAFCPDDERLVFDLWIATSRDARESHEGGEGRRNERRSHHTQHPGR